MAQTIILVTNHPHDGMAVYRCNSIAHVESILDDLGKDMFEEGDESEYVLPQRGSYHGFTYHTGDFDLRVGGELMYECHIDLVKPIANPDD